MWLFSQLLDKLGRVDIYKDAAHKVIMHLTVHHAHKFFYRSICCFKILYFQHVDLSS